MAAANSLLGESKCTLEHLQVRLTNAMGTFFVPPSLEGYI